jgi:hypothetical protein
VDARSIVSRGVSTGLRLGRGTADRLVTLAGPPVGRLADQVLSKVRRHEAPTTTTFTPSKQRSSAPQAPGGETSPHTDERLPSPAVVARNIAPQRPTAKPARAPKTKSVPGAKLPPPRPSTS